VTLLECLVLLFWVDAQEVKTKLKKATIVHAIRAVEYFLIDSMFQR